jgi:UDP-4-amino-4-deoxy-L-arabinose formyltransferase/UDP-glucuronic acid dehydrogenase (UDP-4-keto-hexauronic acid decarboxylating)
VVAERAHEPGREDTPLHRGASSQVARDLQTEPALQAISPAALSVVKRRFHKIVLCGDIFGVKRLISVVPHDAIAGIIGASIRPQYLDDLGVVAESVKAPLLIQPEHRAARYDSFMTDVRRLKVDMLICSSYSMIIRDEILEVVNGNAVNVHASLLPKNRGPNPIQWTIIRGEDSTGITMHYMNSKVDSGDMVAQHEIRVQFDDTWVLLRDRIAAEMTAFLKAWVPEILCGGAPRIRQDESQATSNPRLGPEYPKIDFDTMSDLQIYNLIRAQVAPLRGAYVEAGGRKVHLDVFVPFEEISGLRKRYG